MREFWADYLSFMRLMFALILFITSLFVGIGIPFLVAVGVAEYTHIVLGCIVAFGITPFMFFALEKIWAKLGLWYRNSEKLTGYRHD